MKKTVYPQLKAKKRTLLGRKVKRLRVEGWLPANLYGKGIKSQSLQVKEADFLKVFKEAGETGLVSLIIEEEKEARPVLLHKPQKEPVNGRFLHVDFRQVDLKQKITAAVPVELQGEAPAVAAGGVLVQLISELEVEALPTDLPEKLTVDIGQLKEIGEGISVEDLVYDKEKLVLKIEDPKTLIVKIEAPAKEEEVKPAIEETASTEEKKTEEMPQTSSQAQPTETEAKTEVEKK